MESVTLIYKFKKNNVKNIMFGCVLRKNFIRNLRLIDDSIPNTTLLELRVISIILNMIDFEISHLDRCLKKKLLHFVA